MNAPQIIAEALRINALCRPVGSHRVGAGEALEVSLDGFYLVNEKGNFVCSWHICPAELVLPWELTSKEIIAEEWRVLVSVPW